MENVILNGLVYTLIYRANKKPKKDENRSKPGRMKSVDKKIIFRFTHDTTGMVRVQVCQLTFSLFGLLTNSNFQEKLHV